MCKLKQDMQSQPGYVQLTAQSKVKHVKKSSAHTGGLFSTSSHKRTKSQDSKEFLAIPPSLIDKMNQQMNQQHQTIPNQHHHHHHKLLTRLSNKNLNVGHSATLPMGSTQIYSENA